MRRKVSAANWKYPLRMTFRQWRRLPYPYKHWEITRAQCNLMGYWRDCKTMRCRRAHGCLFPDQCYWARKSALSASEQNRMDALCTPLRKLLDIGSRRGSEGLSLF